MGKSMEDNEKNAPTLAAHPAFFEVVGSNFADFPNKTYWLCLIARFQKARISGAQRPRGAQVGEEGPVSIGVGRGVGRGVGSIESVLNLIPRNTAAIRNRIRFIRMHRLPMPPLCSPESVLR